MDTDNRTAGDSGDPQRGASGSTPHIQQDLPRSKIEPLQKLVVLIRCEPTVLSDVFAKGFATNLCVQFRLELSVIGVVASGGGPRSGIGHLDLRSKRIARQFSRRFR